MKKIVKSLVYFMTFAVFLWNSGVVTIQFSGISIANAQENEAKVTICHYPPGNPENAQTLEVSENAVGAHLEHGDTLGACMQQMVGPLCGNGIYEPGNGEECDNGAGNKDNMQPIWAMTEAESFRRYCSTSCEIYDVPGMWCGDGTLDNPEQCDDGNDVDGDGCTNNCTLEESYSCDNVTSQNGWYGVYYNYLAEHPDMDLPSNQWPDDGHGDPLGTWDTDWYDSSHFKFNRVDSNLTFGGDFFPFDFAAEEINNGHDYHFGIHWRAEVTAPVAGDYNFTLTSDDDVWIYLDGVLVVDNKGIHAPTTINGSLALNGSHIVDIFFAERHTVLSHMYFDFLSDELTIVPMPEDCENPDVYPGPWCSILYGLMQSGYPQSAVGYEVLNFDLTGDDVIDASDGAFLGQLYGAGDNDACYAQFQEVAGGYRYSCVNYLNYDWCNGLLQGLKDSYQSTKNDGSGRYWSYFDFNDDEAINLSDLAFMGQYIATKDQQGCYDRLVPPLLQCPVPQECGNGIIEGDEECDTQTGITTGYYCSNECTLEPIVIDPFCGDGTVNQDWEQCDGDEPQACTTDSGYAGTKSCRMLPVEVFQTLVQDVLYCVWNPCISDEFCGDQVLNGNEECDYALVGSDVCSSDCHTITPPEPSCGDRVCNGDETCGTCPQDCGQCPTPPSGGGGGGGSIIPNISSIYTAPQCTNTVISWLTSSSAPTWIVYGTESENYTHEYRTEEKLTGHSITLDNLAPGTTYYFQIKMEKLGGTVVVSEEKTLTTNVNCGQVLGEKIEQCDWSWRTSGSTGVDKDIIGRTEFPDGTLLRGCTPAIYHLEHQKLRYIRTLQELRDKYRGQRIYNVLDSTLDLFR